MNSIILCYDDTVKTNNQIQTIIGKKSFGKIILKRRSMFSRIKEVVKSSKARIKIINIEQVKDFGAIKQYPEDTIFLHLLSSSAILSKEELIIFLQKLEFLNENLVIRRNGHTFGAAFCNRSDYEKFLNDYCEQGNLDFLRAEEINLDLFIDISNYDSLLMYISGGFDARFFNALEGDSYTVTKKSADKKKMKMEYTYYWLLPERMKSFMVMPYDYRETDDWASYTMERMPMTDIAIRWTHGAIDIDEFGKIMDRVFYFLKTRESREVSQKKYNETADKLYLKKLDERTEKLKALSQYEELSLLIKTGTDYDSFDEIIQDYKTLYTKITKRLNSQKDFRSVIGHGDVFFANMLYSKETNLLRLIDPKGALEEKDLWTDPYYDIAKLSHSVCGNYDFFNTGSYDITLDKSMHFSLNIHTDNTKYVEVFKKYLQENGYDYTLTRLYESSLFLSMLPLHIDNPHKVFGFILNAINILKEVKENV